MNNLDDELDLRYHRGHKPDVYYRCPTLESLDGALQNELQKSSLSIIPVEVVTEFVFSYGSTITIPVSQQTNLDALGFLPADVPQSITVEHALCPNIEGKSRLRTQRAIARSFIESMQSIDGFKYSERQAYGNSDGTRFKYVCLDSLQNRDRRGNGKKGNNAEDIESTGFKRKRKGRKLPTYDCGGAVHIKFSAKREAINVVYKHNPIHRDTESRVEHVQHDSPLPTTETPLPQTPEQGGAKDPREQNRSEKTNASEHGNPGLDMSTSPEVVKAVSKKKRQKNIGPTSPENPKTSKKQSKPKQPQTPVKAKKVVAADLPISPPSAKPIKGKACIRCREKRIKCNEAKPTCNQCQRGLWTCQYELRGATKRSRNGCLNCRQRKRKCTEERPSCAYCLKVDDDCGYPNATL